MSQDQLDTSLSSVLDFDVISPDEHSKCSSLRLRTSVNSEFSRYKNTN